MGVLESGPVGRGRGKGGIAHFLLIDSPFGGSSIGGVVQSLDW